ncbi:MAG TPA: Na+/H+ antiporter subunit E [Nitrospira sp.]|nr:Na+/H+ antiporter subunit E [Nitrospira sp.]
MTKLCPFPMLSMALASAWRLLEGFSPLHLASACLFAIVIPFVIAPLLGGLPGIRSVPGAIRLAGHVVWDIVIANITVARLVLGPVSRLRPAFVKVPVTVTHPSVISLFMSMISITPGSIPLELSPDARTMLVHVLDLEDEEAFIAKVKERYERPLMEILEC